MVATSEEITGRLQEAGMEGNMIAELTSNRLDWKSKVKKRKMHMEEYERQQRKRYTIPEGTDKIDETPRIQMC